MPRLTIWRGTFFMEENVKQYYGQLVNSLKVLCMDDTDYGKYLPDFTDKPFEIMDGFWKAFEVMPQIVEASLLANPAIASILRLNNYLDWLAEKKEYKTLPDDAFFALTEWKQAKGLAREALREMKESAENPDIRFI